MKSYFDNKQIDEDTQIEIVALTKQYAQGLVTAEEVANKLVTLMSLTAE